MYFLAGFLLGLNYMYLVALLLFIGMIGSTVAAYVHHTAVAAVSGIAILLASFVPFSFDTRTSSFFSILDMARYGPRNDDVAFYCIPVIGCVILATAFMTHSNKASTKLRAIYFIPAVIFVLISITERNLGLVNK